MVSHVCIFRMRGKSAGRHIDRPRAKYRSTSIKYDIIYDKPCMYVQDERWVGRSAGRHIYIPGVKYRYTLTPMYIIYDKACEYNQEER